MTELAHNLDPDAIAAAMPSSEPQDSPQSMSRRLKDAPWQPVTTIVRILVHTLAFSAFLFPFQWHYLPLMAFMYVWMCMTTSLYLHRTLSHRCMELARPLRFFFTCGASVNLGGDPVSWVGVHRHHHAYSDTANDIHSPHAGFVYAQGLWAHKIDLTMQAEVIRLAPDVATDPFHRWMLNPNQYVIPHLVVAAVIGFTLGGPALLYGLYLPLMALIHITHAVNSFGHMPRFGYRTHETRDDSTNVPWLALLTLGDSFHNNHHAQPRRAPHGTKWHELDLNKYVIWVFEKLGLAKKVVW